MSVENNKGDKISKLTGLHVRKYNRKVHLKEESDLESLYTSEDDNMKNKRQKNSHIFKLPQHNLLSLSYKKTESLNTCENKNLKDNNSKRESHISELHISSKKTQVEDNLTNKPENVLDTIKNILELSQNILKEIKNDNENFKKEILRRIDENTNNIKIIRETELINNTHGRVTNIHGRVAPYLDTFQRQNFDFMNMSRFQESRNMFNYYHYPNPDPYSHYYYQN